MTKTMNKSVKCGFRSTFVSKTLDQKKGRNLSVLAVAAREAQIFWADFRNSFLSVERSYANKVYTYRDCIYSRIS